MSDMEHRAIFPLPAYVQHPVEAGRTPHGRHYRIVADYRGIYAVQSGCTEPVTARYPDGLSWGHVYWADDIAHARRLAARLH